MQSVGTQISISHEATKIKAFSPTWSTHLSGEFHIQGVGIEHRRANTSIDPTAHATMIPIKA
jgi:hypothetical protein